NEFDPEGPVQLKEVEEVFVRVAPIVNVHVGDQIIRTTVEHPFYVVGRSWIPAGMLNIGDLLMMRDGSQVPVGGVADSGEVTTVYNWQIAQHHTYFVSATEVAVSVWAHNAGGYGTGQQPPSFPNTRLVDTRRLLPPPGGRQFADPAKLASHGPFDWLKYQPIVVEETQGGIMYV